MKDSETNDRSRGRTMKELETNDRTRGRTMKDSETNDRSRGRTMKELETNDRTKGKEMKDSEINDRTKGETREKDQVQDLTRYLSDESFFSGSCEKAITVRRKEDVLEAFRSEQYLTMQGARTGLSGACVPTKGCVLDFSQWQGLIRTEKEGDSYTMTFAPGTSLSQIRKEIRRQAPGYCWKPDPTEENASIAGLVSMDARGPSCYRWGSVSDHIASLEGITLSGEEILLSHPDEIKMAAGQEGNLFAITSCSLRLLPCPSFQYILIIFFEEEKMALAFQNKLVSGSDSCDLLQSLTAMDYIDPRALEVYRRFAGQQNKWSILGSIPDQARCAVYVILEDEADPEEDLMGILSQLDEQGVEEDCILAASEQSEIDRFKEFRHGVQEALNQQLQLKRNCFSGPWPGQIAAGSQDWSAADLILEIRNLLTESGGPSYAILSHYASREIHLIFFPENEKERDWLLKDLIQVAKLLADKGIYGQRGIGIGKLNRCFFLASGSDASFEQWKARFDPSGRFNPNGEPYSCL